MNRFYRGNDRLGGSPRSRPLSSLTDETLIGGRPDEQMTQSRVLLPLSLPLALVLVPVLVPVLILVLVLAPRRVARR